jgi:hypothetical protein
VRIAAATKLRDLTLRGLPLRRAVAVACAFVFLLVGFCHSFQHANAGVPVVALQMQSDGSDNSPDAPVDVEIGIDHCHGCVIVGIPIEGQTTLPSRIKTAYPPARLVSLRPYSPIAETPPPIFQI